MDFKAMQNMIKYGKKEEALAVCQNKATDANTLVNLLIFSVQKNWLDVAEKSCAALTQNVNQQAKPAQWIIDIAGRYCLMQNNVKIFKKIEHMVDKKTLCDLLLADMGQNNSQFDQAKHTQKILKQMELLLEGADDDFFIEATQKSDVFSQSLLIKSRMDHIAMHDQIKKLDPGNGAGAERKNKKI